ncbi:PD-(D/E)XK nuclease family protein [Clostridium autoethanogenum]|nr:PD-(D/E)XK nuclease family protein [Clostridium autoethanogenum]
MERKVYMEKLFSKQREKLIDMCIRLQKQGERFLYIMPSSAAIKEVRRELLNKSCGLLDSKVIVFDDLEMDIVKEEIPQSRVIFDPVVKVIISEICSKLKETGKLKYYEKLYDKKGFHSEIAALIRSLKRNCIDEEKFSKVKENIEDEVLKAKVEDLFLIYTSYNKNLKENNIYDRNDIPLEAIRLARNFKKINKYDSIIIDGFTDIENISIELIEEIAGSSNVNIYVNCPYVNSFMKDFLGEEIKKPFEKMGFEIVSEDGELYDIKDDFKKLGNKFYSGERLSCNVEGLNIKAYPCIKTEIRETARDIKEKLMAKVNPKDIAIYINNREDYYPYMVDIFNEFNIPVALNYEIALSSSELIRKMVKGLLEYEKDSCTGEEWFEILHQQMESKKDYMAGLIYKVFNSNIDVDDKFELMAFEGFKNLIHELKLSFEKSEMINNDILKEDFVQLLSDCIQGVTVTVKKGNNEGIRILNTALAKGVYFKHVYILGLNEGELPKCVKNNGLFDSFETSILSKNGIRYKDYLWELNREKIRFNLSIASAEETLNLSYRFAGEDGKFAIASSFIDEIKFMCNVDKINRLTMRNRFEIKYDEVMSSYELQAIYLKNCFESKYLNNEIHGSKESLSFIEKGVNKIIDKGLVEYHREKEEDFNEYEGILKNNFKDISETLCKFSPSSLNEYLKCPFRYMMNTLFNLGEEEEEEEFSSLEIGSFYHSVLYRYYSSAQQFECFDEEIFEAVFRKSLGELRKIDVPKEELNLIFNCLYKVLKNFITADIKRMGVFTDVSQNSILKPYILEKFFEEEEVFGVPIRCKIDRVDLEYRKEGKKLIPTGRYVIYDYKKSGILGMKDIVQNNDYQTAIYYYVVEKELKKLLKTDQVECMALLYLSIEKTEDTVEKDGIYKTEYKKQLDFARKRSDINGDKFTVLMEYIKDSILDTIASIKQGKFNYKPMCSFFEEYSTYSCDFQKLCRYSTNKMRAIMENQFKAQENGSDHKDVLMEGKR